ncbi:uncharacterized protein K460DRAFT_47297 [Cucurbitaria berberidis CBS 394.84]|uniref:Aminoglycoside phosphotransferase domain-containing protein n=1 Tax=Cucurbitaria berberidis CBS 394.84 TaxID=1168544 RepID=A0A9P4GUL8_9PLEO|nr:uncharacterized protein K460DRAFT_47297 [Cucurbitaria berberidis CBS 394.84]KAF1852122.1 hypothetical protein K460DRAFT_47297 [Cucurbitaria berberidis CBS 394.84]
MVFIITVYRIAYNYAATYCQDPTQMNSLRSAIMPRTNLAASLGCGLSLNTASRVPWCKYSLRDDCITMLSCVWACNQSYVWQNAKQDKPLGKHKIQTRRGRPLNPHDIMSALTDAQINLLCHDPAAIILSAPEYSDKVIRITNELVVKFGQHVTIQEFRNQQTAQQRLDADVDGSRATWRWTNIWEVAFSKTEDLQLWLNRRSPNSEHKPNLCCYPLAMCHLDLNPRNLMVDGSRIYVLDWSAAGYFPRLLKHTLYQFLLRDLSFFNIVEPFLIPLSNEESDEAKIVTEILRCSQIHVFREAKVSRKARLGA